MASGSDDTLPETRFAQAGEVSIAYQVMGDGPVDLVFVPGMVSHVEFWHELPGYTRFIRRLASFARVAIFDKRGQGLSDRVSGAPSLEERMDDLRAVMDAAGMARAAILGQSEGACMSALFAATFPERVSHLVLYGGFARFVNGDDYSLMFDPVVFAQMVPAWGTGQTIKAFGHSHRKNPEVQRLWAKGERLIASPGTFKAMLESNFRIDVRAILPQVRVPTLVLHRLTDRAIPVANGRFLAEQVPGARYIEYPDGDHAIFSGVDIEPICGDIEEFLTGQREQPTDDTERVLATVLFTDIVDSTRRLTEMGDTAWRRTLDEHDRLARRAVEQHRGRFVKSTGDGVLATFDGPARAVRCARALSDGVKHLGIATRAGLHTGEIELRGEDVGGLAVHVAARVMAEAAPGEVLVSRVLTDLVAGASLSFEPRGARALKGLDGSWDLFALREG
jgi:class 3 adenylate cyclase